MNILGGDSKRHKQREWEMRLWRIFLERVAIPTNIWCSILLSSLHRAAILVYIPSIHRVGKFSSLMYVFFGLILLMATIGNSGWRNLPPHHHRPKGDRNWIIVQPWGFLLCLDGFNCNSSPKSWLCDFHHLVFYLKLSHYLWTSKILISIQWM